MGRTDIEDAFKKLDTLINEEVRMAIAQTLTATIERKEGMRSVHPVAHFTLNRRPLRLQESRCGFCGKDGRNCEEHKRNKVFVIC